MNVAPWSLPVDADRSTPDAGTDLDLLPVYGELAPSPCNLRPWAFRRTRDALEVGPDTTLAPALGDAAHREVILSCGAALLNMRMALRHFGRRDAVTRIPELHSSWALARLTAERRLRPSAADDTLFHAIRRRHTATHGFVDHAVPPGMFEELRMVARRHGAWLHGVVSPTERGELCDLAFEAFAALSGHGDAAACAQWGGPRDAAEMAAAARHTRRLLLDAPVVAILGTDEDEAPDWLTAGEALEAVLLHAAANGILAAYVNQPLRVAELRPWVRIAAGHGGAPHVLFALGYVAGP
jgi:hypothetical protein